MSRTHELKAWPDPFDAVLRGDKRYEVRPDDRAFAVGDTLHLREWCPPEGPYTGREAHVEVTYLTRGAFGVPPGLVVMSVTEPVPCAPDTHCGVIHVQNDYHHICGAGAGHAGKHACACENCDVTW